MWKADLRVGDRCVGVKLYAAVEDAKVHFRLLHRADQAPVRQQMVDAESGAPVSRELQRKGIAIDRDRYVLLTDAELDEIEPVPSREITVLQVIEAAQLDERWLDRPYYLGPDRNAAAYFALAAAIEQRGALLLAHWVMRKRRYAGAIYASGGYLMLETAHRADELAELAALRPPANREPGEREIALAEQLIATLEGTFDPADYVDHYSAAVRRMVEQKASGKVVRFPAAERRRRSESLIADLEASLTARRKAAGGR
jgi:DNA end-binding protein Ku